jgi:hypothetical protein
MAILINAIFLKSWLEEQNMTVKKEFYTRKSIVCDANDGFL